jgi:hypothetical protein
MELLPEAKIKRLTVPILTIIRVYRDLCEEHLVEGCITGGWDNPAYPKGGVHDDGRALDLRSYIFNDPNAIAAELQSRLRLIDDGFGVLYHDAGSGMHFHCQWMPPGYTNHLGGE